MCNHSGLGFKTQDNKSMTGTARYASVTSSGRLIQLRALRTGRLIRSASGERSLQFPKVNAHRGIEQSRRDDIEAIGLLGQSV